MKMMLNDIALKTGTDKSSSFHNYCKYYERHFESRRLDPITLIEIGVYHGQSIKMWREYFPNATIIGVDIDPRYETTFTQDDKTKFVLGDATKKEVFEKIVKDFGTPDIVIDDGSHIMSDMKNAFELIYPYLNDNGVYCIEDLGVCGKGGRRNFYRPGDISMLDHLGTKVMEDLNLCKKDWTCSNKDKKLDMLKNSTPPLSVFEKTVYEMHLYTGLAIICKK